ncbi:MAG: DUF4214 domain-containing protein [Laribacter sp.]|nr:DUF4214 domain-containing protein [Laribacter sp.]MBP9526734.1 DUF4214 domain-containing protein [Laribacter sp.]MBP9607793.1 DUF4214 domain-containing protein [Laribacter sp.]
MAVAAANIHELYIAYFGRAADKAGLDYWLAEGQKEGVTLEVIAKSFSDQVEATGQYRLLNDPALVASAAEREDFLTDVYQNLFGRAPDAAGLAYWSDVLAKGGKDAVGRIIIDIVGGAVGDDHQLIANKSTVSDMYAKLQNDLKIQMTDADMDGNGVFDFVDAKNALNDLLKNVPTDPVAFELFKSQVQIEAERVAAQSNELVIGTGDTTAPFEAKASSGDDVVVLNASSNLDGYKSISGGTGSDTLRLEVAVVDKTDASKFSGFETLQLKGVATQDVTLFSGIKHVEVAGTSTVTLNDGTLVSLLDGANVTLTDKAASATDYAVVETNGDATLTANGYELLSLTAKQGGSVELNQDALTKLVINNVAVDDAATPLDESLLTLDVTGASKLTSINASASKGSLDLTADSSVASVSTGAGNDKITIEGDLAAKAGNTLAGTQSIDAGAGNDKITFTGNVNGTTPADGASLTINGGAGNDTITLDGSFTGNTTLTGGEGKDLFDLTKATGTLSISDFVSGQDKLAVGLTKTTDFGGDVTSQLVLNKDGSVDLANTLSGAKADGIVYFHHGDNTYVLVNDNTAGYSAANDLLITLTGKIDLTLTDVSGVAAV